MKETNPVLHKSFQFALRIVSLCQSLNRGSTESVLARQVLRSGTSIGANVEEAVGGQSRADFYSKMTIAYKEARETSYWLRLLGDSGTIPREACEPLQADLEELLRIIGSIQITTKRRMTLRNPQQDS